ncbi:MULTISPECIES: HdeD family acid-resistance protein [Microbulbifer]|uniref:HdeD family acid-resistance protein n=1 Tax=Microbulbifer TaxID=48073 RepID=UPI001E286995|nr:MULTISPECIES: HdeD family acid-resistance protein [Microbulbifer]UHQ53688.1 HdeD family acid-resistance protein [Microbulbifer sp. YPW16]
MDYETTTMATRPVLRVLTENWWVLLLRGVCAVLFGILAFIWPGLSLLTLVILFGAFVFADGFLALVAAVLGRHESTPLWWLIIAGLVSVAAGIATFIYPQVTGLVLMIFIGSWALVRGVFEVIGAIRLRQEIQQEWLLIASGLLSVIFGIAVLVSPGAGALALLWVIAGYAIAFGLLEIWLALRLRKYGRAAA